MAEGGKPSTNAAESQSSPPDHDDDNEAVTVGELKDLLLLMEQKLTNKLDGLCKIGERITKTEKDVANLEFNVKGDRVSNNHDNVEECQTPNFGSLMLQKQQQYQQEGLLCDFQLQAEGKTFQVHRLVLASCSDYFRALFSHDVVENRQNSVVLPAVTARGLEPLIGYMYTGKMKLCLDSIQDVLGAASFLQMTSAIELSVTYLKGKMDFDNAEEVVRMGELYSIPALKIHHRDYILENFLSLAKSDSFLNIDGGTLVDYLQDDRLKTSSESKLLHYALSWFNHDPKNREKHAFEVFEKIRYVVDGWAAIHHAGKVEPFTTNPKCQDLLTYATDLMTNPAKKYLTQNQNCRTKVRYGGKTLVQFGGIMRFSYDQHDDVNIPQFLENQTCGWSRNRFYNNNTKAWLPLGCLATSPDHLSHCTVVEVNDYGILIGGYIHQLQAGGDSQKKTSKSVKFFDPAHFSLWDMAALQHERAHHTAVYLADYIYAIGGKDDKQALSSVERLDCDKEKWGYVRPLPRPLYDHGAAACCEKIYVTGGVEGNTVTNKMWCYEPKQDKWSKRAALLTARAAHGMVTLNQQLYVCGGYTAISNPRCLSSLETYSVEKNQWTHLTPMRTDLANSTTVVLNDKIVVLGGENSVGDLTEYIRQYDPVKDTWTLFGSLPRPLKNIGCCAVTIKLRESSVAEKDDVLRKYTSEWDEDEGRTPGTGFEDDYMDSDFDYDHYLDYDDYDIDYDEIDMYYGDDDDDA